MVDDHTDRKAAANRCRDLPPNGEAQISIYPSHYQHLLVEVGLTANRGAGLAPRLAVTVRRTGQCLAQSIRLVPMGRRRAAFARQTEQSIRADFSKSNFFDRNATIFGKSMCIRKIGRSVSCHYLKDGVVTGSKFFFHKALVFSDLMGTRRYKKTKCIQWEDQVAEDSTRYKVFHSKRDHFSGCGAH